LLVTEIAYLVNRVGHNIHAKATFT
jgi:hypothetical protein